MIKKIAPKVAMVSRNRSDDSFGVMSEEVMIPADKCGLIVGKAGVNIKRLQVMHGKRNVIKFLKISFGYDLIDFRNNSA